ncbi:MAG TPA: permease [Balneolales bacterium]|nr:permease [Balneolales bacterium]
MIKSFTDWLVYGLAGLSAGTHFSDAVHFFVYDTIKIGLLLVLITFIMGAVNSYFPVEKVRKFLSSRQLYGGQYLLASVFGAATPFCSCSSIPLFIGFLQGGIPLGVTFSYLITSPLVNEVALALFIGLFGWKVTLIYAGSGILLGTMLGLVLSQFGLERYVESWVWDVARQQTGRSVLLVKNPRFIERLPGILREAGAIIRRIGLYVLLGVAIGGAIHGYVPTGYFQQYLTASNPLAVPVSVIVAIPMYANASAAIPIMEALVTKGIPMGTALAFMMAVVGLSLPEAMILKKVMRLQLLGIFFGAVGGSIILLGYFFNVIL